MTAYLETGCLEESLAAVLAPVSPLVVVLLPVENRRVSVCELSPAILALEQDFILSSSGPGRCMAVVG